MIQGFKVRKGHQVKYDPTYHCAVARSRLGKITPCWGLRELGRYDCEGTGYECPIARWWDEKGKYLKPVENPTFPATRRIGIGDTVYRWDDFVEVGEDGLGRQTGKWFPVKIEGETGRSWIVKVRWQERKLPKRGDWPRGWCRSLEDVRDCVALSKAWSVAELCRKARASQLITIGRILGLDMSNEALLKDAVAEAEL